MNIKELKYRDINEKENKKLIKRKSSGESEIIELRNKLQYSKEKIKEEKNE